MEKKPRPTEGPVIKQILIGNQLIGFYITYHWKLGDRFLNNTSRPQSDQSDHKSAIKMLYMSN